MGPNAYLTPPGSFTQVHQDGHGTVDSGHLCLTGYNEVVMLRRLPERHKINALALLRGEGGGEKYDGLYGLPHDEVRIPLMQNVQLVTSIVLSSRVSLHRVVLKSQIGRQLKQSRNVKRRGKSCVSFDESIKQMLTLSRSIILLVAGTAHPSLFSCLGNWSILTKGDSMHLESYGPNILSRLTAIPFFGVICWTSSRRRVSIE